MIPKPHLLIVDDEPGIRESLASILRDEGYLVDAVGSAEEALDRVAAGELELILLDVWLPGMDGLEALSRIQSAAHPPAVVMISGHGTIETAVRATKLGAFDFIEKPLSLEKIVLRVRNAVQQRRLEEENQTLRNQLGHRYQVICYCSHQRPGFDLRREWYRQRIGGACPARREPANQGPLRGSELRGDPGRTD
jgi:two-component system nitrogen regulation response regulator NtrX